MHMNMFARTNHLAVVLGFYPDLAHAFVCVLHESLVATNIIYQM